MQKTNTKHFLVALWNHENKVKVVEIFMFRTNWFFKYGLQVSTRDPTTKEITSVGCLICKRFGCEGKEEND